MQRAVIDELLAARPPGGFPTIENAPEGSLEAYVASNLWWHVRGGGRHDDIGLHGMV